MTVVTSWNIQYGKGVDGIVDLRRIVDTARRLGAFDVLCVQEIAVNFAEMGGGATVDQTAQLAALLPGYAPVFSPAVDLLGDNGARRKFGNMILSRLPVLETTNFPMPRPADATVLHMPRSALCAVMQTPRGPIRVMTTHLEFHSAQQRAAQADRLRAIYAEAAANDRRPPVPGPGPYRVRPPATGTIICGDFNFELSEPPYAALTAPFGDGTETLADAWMKRFPATPHAPTCGIHDRAQWPQGPHARDFMFVSAGLASRIDDIKVDTETAASDHQPVRLALAD
ncbi:MAG: endonuclease/exonuclease/phosphatase family protein [Proteobacteria bacterium]|nr:endonuclease/exonuclease/phosphatase family protein [Pseudomonadota bacterium]